MIDQINSLKEEYLKEIAQADSLETADKIFLKLFGKNGEVTLLPKDFPTLAKEELKTVGPAFNQLKNTLEQAIAGKRQALKETQFAAISSLPLDLETNSEIKKREGHLHPLTEFEDQIVQLFKDLGFQQFEAPLVDSDYYNFEVLNIPQEHPARDLWDTMYIESPKEASEKLLLRTHTSNSQVRIMKQFEPPIRMMVLGRCFRYENLDARHEHTFDQFELVFVDKGLSMANLQYLSEYFLKAVLGEEIEVRLKPKYYPFVEPGVGIDGKCLFCKGKGCKVCGEGWLELGGAGMIHPNVLRNGGIDPEVYSGIAWGPGLERILMLKKQINDLRQFRNGDLKFLEEVSKR